MMSIISNTTILLNPKFHLIRIFIIGEEPKLANTAKDNVGTGAMEFVSCADESPEGKKGYTRSKMRSSLAGQTMEGCLSQP